MSTDRITEHIAYAERAVAHLLTQYQEYLALVEAIERARSEKLAHIATISRQRDVPLKDVLADERAYDELQRDIDAIRRLEVDRDQLSDDMTFANPLVWIMYKDRAYRGTSQEIRTWAAFKLHCAPEGYICGKRFRFLTQHLATTRRVTFATALADDMPLAAVAQQPLITGLLDDDACMAHWRTQEYLRTDGKVTKWGI